MAHKNIFNFSFGSLGHRETVQEVTYLEITEVALLPVQSFSLTGFLTVRSPPEARQVGVIIIILIIFSLISKLTSICIVSSGEHKDGDIKTKVNHGLASKMLILWEL